MQWKLSEHGGIRESKGGAMLAMIKKWGKGGFREGNGLLGKKKKLRCGESLKWPH